jgi:hypothetical protein
VILCDPPLTRVYIGNGTKSIDLGSNKPFNAGLKDFVPLLLRQNIKPPQASMLESLFFYFTNYGHLLSSPTDPFCTALYPLKIITIHYGRNWGLLHLQVNTMSNRDWAVTRHTTTAADEADSIEADWLAFRSVSIRYELEEIFEALAIPACDPGPEKRRTPDWRDWETDFQLLRIKLKSSASSYADLTGQISARYGLVAQRQLQEEARRNREETKMVTKLTTLVTVFAPPTLATGILSMNGPFTPGERLFWVFFILLFVFFGATVLFVISAWTYPERKGLVTALGYYRFKHFAILTGQKITGRRAQKTTPGQS